MLQLGGLLVTPLPSARVVGIFEPSVWIHDLVPVHVIDHIGAFRQGVCARHAATLGARIEGSDKPAHVMVAGRGSNPHRPTIGVWNLFSRSGFSSESRSPWPP